MAWSYFPQNTGSVWFWNLNLLGLLLFKCRICKFMFRLTVLGWFNSTSLMMSLCGWILIFGWIYLLGLKPKDMITLHYKLCVVLLLPITVCECAKVGWSVDYKWWQVDTCVFLGLVTYFVLGNGLNVISIYSGFLQFYFGSWSFIFLLHHFFPSTENPTPSPNSFIHNFVFLRTNHFNDY